MKLLFKQKIHTDNLLSPLFRYFIIDCMRSSEQIPSVIPDLLSSVSSVPHIAQAVVFGKLISGEKGELRVMLVSGIYHTYILYDNCYFALQKIRRAYLEVNL